MIPQIGEIYFCTPSYILRYNGEERSSYMTDRHYYNGSDGGMFTEDYVKRMREPTDFEKSGLKSVKRLKNLYIKNKLN